MESALLIIQGVIAAIFGFIGIVKTIEPIDKLIISGLQWVERFSPNTIRLIGFLEILGAIGIILPEILHFGFFVVPIAASCLALIMLLAIIHHLRNNEYEILYFNFLLLAGNLLVIYKKL